MIPQIITQTDIKIQNKLEPIWETLSLEAQNLILSLLQSEKEFEELLIDRAISNYPDFWQMLTQKIISEKQTILQEFEKEDKDRENINFYPEIL